jgi:hypothetical protein
MRKTHHGVLITGCLILAALAYAAPVLQRPADTLPAQYTDSEFWRLVEEFSEPGGAFPYENFVSNEAAYQVVLPEVMRTVKTGGVYLGVAPEQNFSYVAALKPKVAFIIDIRRQNLVELLMYKALFEMSPTRGDFLSKLFSRRTDDLGGTVLAPAPLLSLINSARPDQEMYKETLQAIRDRLTKQHQFKLTADDIQKIDYIFNVFFRGGPRMDYAYASRSPNSSVPSFYNLMTSTDGRGQNWAFLANEENYKFVRDMQLKNLIIPVVGDFAGPKAIKAIGQYLKDHKALVTVFYISNVEDYLEPVWTNYRSNLAALPVEENGLFIRFAPQNMYLRPIKEVPTRWPGRTW